MSDVRFPYVAFYRRLHEARDLDEATLRRWLRDRTKAKRRAAETELKRRGLPRV